MNSAQANPESISSELSLAMNSAQANPESIPSELSLAMNSAQAPISSELPLPSEPWQPRASLATLSYRERKLKLPS